MSSSSTPRSVGETAPGFMLQNQHGEPVSLGDYAGTRNVMLVFYPFAFSGICTGELTEIRDRLEDFQGKDIAVLAISCDPMYSLRAFADAHGYFFPLLSDFWPHGRVAASYGVLNEVTGGALRGTFLVDREGIICWTLVNGPGERRDFSGFAAARAAIA